MPDTRIDTSGELIQAVIGAKRFGSVAKIVLCGSPQVFLLEQGHINRLWQGGAPHVEEVAKGILVEHDIFRELCMFQPYESIQGFLAAIAAMRNDP